MLLATIVPAVIVLVAIFARRHAGDRAEDDHPDPDQYH
jgi:hypothetical protein